MATRKKAPETTYAMPKEVSEWIEQAHAKIQHLQGEVDRLKEDNRKLKSYQKWATDRITRSDHE